MLENKSSRDKSMHRSLSKSELKSKRKSLSGEEEDFFDIDTNSDAYVTDLYRGMLRLVKLLGLQNWDYKLGEVLGVGAYSTVYKC